MHTCTYTHTRACVCHAKIYTERSGKVLIIHMNKIRGRMVYIFHVYWTAAFKLLKYDFKLNNFQNDFVRIRRHQFLKSCRNNSQVLIALEYSYLGETCTAWCRREHSFYITYSFIHSFIPWCVLRQVHSLFQSEFTQCDLVLPLSVYSALSFSFRPSSSCLRFLPRLPVTSIWVLNAIIMR